MQSNRICSSCQKPVAQDGPMGLCPECLILAGFLTEAAANAERKHQFSAPTIEELAPQFPQLDILEFIGQGGIGAVYQARQKDLDRIVALKILAPDIGQDAAFAERFAHEAKALAKLNHPGIVTIHDFGRAGGLYFFLMEFVDGLNLRQLLAHSRLSPREALAIVPQICDALQFAHDHGIVHRDIKPENVLLDRLGRVKVADFGFAQIFRKAGDESNSHKTESLAPTAISATGQTIGTPQYKSPEQLHSPGEVDHRADIYALGVVLYEVLTGELPGEQAYPPSRKVQLDVRLDEVVLRALEQKPELRYQQVSVMKTQLERMTSETSAPGRPGPTSAEQPSPRFQHLTARFQSPFNRLFKWMAAVAVQFCMPILLSILFSFATSLAIFEEMNLWFMAGLAIASVVFFWRAGRSSGLAILEPKRLVHWLLLLTCVSCLTDMTLKLIGDLQSTSGPVLTRWLAEGKNYGSVKKWLSAKDQGKLDNLNYYTYIFADGVKTPLEFNDPTQARQYLSSLTTQKHFGFGVVLDADTNLFASYFQPNQISQRDKFMTKIRHSCPSGKWSAVVVYPTLGIAIQQIKEGKRTMGYVAIGMDLVDKSQP